eukprot:scaffold68448_cov29-Tisochrysis_lutea.AAC.2
MRCSLCKSRRLSSDLTDDGLNLICSWVESTPASAYWCMSRASSGRCTPSEPSEPGSLADGLYFCLKYLAIERWPASRSPRLSVGSDSTPGPSGTESASGL